MSQRILLIQTAFIGDVILATPIVEAIGLAKPDAQLDVLVRKGNESLLIDNPHIDNLYVWDKKHGKYRNLIQLLQTIRQNRYDIVINCQRFAASGFLTAFSGASVRIGFSKNPFSFLFSHKIEHNLNSGKHECERNLALLEPIGINGISRPKLYTPAVQLPAEPYVTLSPASVWFTKQWPKHKWVELIKALPKELSVYLLGSPGDSGLCEWIKEHSEPERVHNRCGKFSLTESAAFMTGARLNVVNDSAPMHLASAVNAPVAAIFCSTVPEFGFGPLSDRSTIIQTPKALSCRPCGLHGFKACPQKHFECAEQIEIEQVLTLLR